MCPSTSCPSVICGQDCELSFGQIFTKFGKQLPHNIPQKTFLHSPRNVRGQNYVTKFVILHILIISACLNKKVFKFNTKLKKQK